MVVARGWRIGAAVAAVALATGCLDGPFARQNPNDPGASVALRLVASQDTVRPSRPYVVIQVVSDPPSAGYTPLWNVAPEGSLQYLGDGVFALGATPSVPTPTTITAAFQTRSLTITVIRAP
jgi:anti-sigma-K factor RskA